MKWLIGLGLLILTPGAVVLLASSAAPQGPCVNTIRHEPVLVYEVSGFGFGGLIDRMLTVYADGSLKLSSAELSGPGKAALAAASPAEVKTLTQTLSLAGSFTACDDQSTGFDVPLKTLTVFRGGTDALTHTVSWWFQNPPYDGLEQPLDAFIAQHFPNF